MLIMVITDVGITRNSGVLAELTYLLGECIALMAMHILKTEKLLYPIPENNFSAKQKNWFTLFQKTIFPQIWQLGTGRNFWIRRKFWHHLASVSTQLVSLNYLYPIPKNWF